MVLPEVLRQSNMVGRLDEVRLRRAMSWLTSFALVEHDEETDSCAMHPLVQRWAREGHGSRAGEQYVWCHAAATMISSGIVSHESNSSESQGLMRQLWPHVRVIEQQLDVLQQRIAENSLGSNRWSPLIGSGPGGGLALKYFKFSIIHASNGRFVLANKQQRIAHRAAEVTYGYKFSETRLITITWSHTLSTLGHADDSAKVLEILLDKCTSIFGPDDRNTCVATIKLADARLQQGRVPEAMCMFESAIPGIKHHYGHEDDETLDALDVHRKIMLLNGTPASVEQARTSKSAPTNSGCSQTSLWPQTRQDLGIAPSVLRNILVGRCRLRTPGYQARHGGDY